MDTVQFMFKISETFRVNMTKVEAEDSDQQLPHLQQI
jgi:hypothetical protein